MELIFVYEAVPLGVLFCSGDPGQEYLNHGGVKHVFVSDRASFRAVHIFVFSPFSNVLGPAAGGGLAPPPRRWFQWSFKDAEMGISQAALGSARGTQQDGGGGGGRGVRRAGDRLVHLRPPPPGRGSRVVHPVALLKLMFL